PAESSKECKAKRHEGYYEVDETMQRGIGRGLATTKPAWMTQGLPSLASTVEGRNGGVPNQSMSNSSRQEVVGGGRGRSKSRSRSMNRNPRRVSDKSKNTRSKSRSRSGSRGGGKSRGGSSAGASMRRLASGDDRNGSHRRRISRSRSRSGNRHDGGGLEASKNGGSGSSYREQAVRALEATTGFRVGSTQIGRGRGRGLTLPAWMSHPNGLPGGLQQQTNKDKREHSPKRFRGRSPPPQSPGAVAGGRGGDRGEVRTGDFMRRGRHGSPGGGRDSGRMNGRVPDKLPELFSVHRGEVVKTETFGAFVKLDGYRKHGLVHCSQMASYRVEDVTDVCKVGDHVFVKVIEVTDAVEPREQRVGLSMKLVDQSSGGDLDLSNAGAEADAQRRKPRVAHGERPTLKLEAVYDTTCTKCGGHGHMSIDCFSREGQKYDLVPDHDPRDAVEGNLQANGGGAMRGVRRESPHGSAAAMGRGRCATMPAWMKDLGLADKLDKKHHRKDRGRSKKKDKGKDRVKDYDGSSESDRDRGDSDSRRRRKKGDRDDPKKEQRKHHRKHGKSSKHEKKHDSRRRRSSSKSSKHEKKHDSRRSSSSKSRGRGESRDEGGKEGSDSRDRDRASRRRDLKRRRSSDSPRRQSQNRNRARVEGGEGRRAGGYDWKRDETKGGHAEKREGQFGDASRGSGGKGGDGDRWKPRADSDRSESRSTR
ncbi:unnamed protein product, partial [Ascophyllum nodosum]